MLRISFGAMSPKLKEQLSPWMLPDEDLARWQKHADSVSALHIFGLVTDAEAGKIRGRICKSICEFMNKRFDANTPKPSPRPSQTDKNERTEQGPCGRESEYCG